MQEIQRLWREIREGRIELLIFGILAHDLREQIALLVDCDREVAVVETIIGERRPSRVELPAIRAAAEQYHIAGA